MIELSSVTHTRCRKMKQSKFRRCIAHIAYLDSAILSKIEKSDVIRTDVARWSLVLAKECRDLQMKKSLLLLSMKHAIHCLEIQLYNQSLELFLYLIRAEIICQFKQITVKDLCGYENTVNIDWPLAVPPTDIKFVNQCKQMIKKQGDGFCMKGRAGIGCACAIFMERSKSLSLKSETKWRIRFADVSKHLRPRFAYPCTVVVEFNEGIVPVVKFYDPFLVSNLNVNGYELGLAANFSFPLLCHFESMMAHVGYIRTIEKNQMVGAIPPLSGVINVPEFQSYQGLYFMFPFNTRRIPIIFIHGFYSNTYAWRYIVNFISPELLSDYQIGFYQYPTGQALLLVLDDLRDSLKYLAGLYPLNQKNLLHKTVLIGHSMGGVLARLLVTSTEKDTILHQQLLNPLIKSTLVNTSKKHDEKSIVSLQMYVKSKLEPLVKWKPLEFVKSVVFIACPHRGVVSYPYLTQLVKRFVYVSPILKQFAAGISKNQEFELADFGSLSYDAPVPRFLAATPLPLHIKCCNIIAYLDGRHVKRLLRSEPKSVPYNDGTVSFYSAHLEGPNIQEFIVAKSTHVDILYKLETSQIIKSILLSNLG